MTRSERWMRGVPGLAAVLALALVCEPGRVSRADDPRDLLGKIEDKLEDAAEALARLPDDGDDGALDRSRAYVAEARRSADELGRVAGDDASAKRIADDFDDVQDDFHDALGHLRGLKAGQRRSEPVVALCGERDQALVRLARGFAAGDDPDGLVELPREAARIQELTRRQLDELARLDAQLDDRADDADDFRGDGPWRPLVASVAQTARRSYALWHRGHAQAVQACAALVLGVDHPAVKEVLAQLGASTGGRQAVMAQLEADARALASTLAGVAEDAGVGSIERARQLLASIARGVDRLGRPPTTDAAARRVVERWPQGIQELTDALDDLEDLKRHQHDLDPLPARCAEQERALHDAIARNGSDPDGIDALPTLAEAVAAPVRARLDQARVRMKEAEGDHARARAVAFSEGPWSEVRAAEQRDADETFQTYREGLQATERACAVVAQGPDAPPVRDAIAALQRGASSSSDQLAREVEAWVARARATYTLDCQGMTELWAAHCSQDWEPGDDAGPRAAARAAAEPIQARMRASIDAVVADLPALETRVKRVADPRETQRAGQALQRELAKQQARLLKLQANPALRGNYDLVLQYAATYGKQQHARMWSAHGCQVPTAADREARFPDEGRDHYKPDCVNPETCEVFEFKADSPSGRIEGRQQVRDYEYLVPRYYNQLLRSAGADAAASDALGGRAVVKALREHCYRDGALRLTVEPVYYDMCQMQYECTRD